MDANGENTPDFCPQPLLKVKTAHRFLQSLWAVFFLGYGVLPKFEKWDVLLRQNVV